jgi:hypothetical protein
MPSSEEGGTMPASEDPTGGTGGPGGGGGGRGDDQVVRGNPRGGSLRKEGDGGISRNRDKQEKPSSPSRGRRICAGARPPGPSSDGDGNVDDAWQGGEVAVSMIGPCGGAEGGGVQALVLLWAPGTPNLDRGMGNAEEGRPLREGARGALASRMTPASAVEVTGKVMGFGRSTRAPSQCKEDTLMTPRDAERTPGESAGDGGARGSTWAPGAAARVGTAGMAGG